ncbi:MAG TPA: MerR family transcriptional regulator [Chthoniobacteraceae bacterium]
MSRYSIQTLAEEANAWCDAHSISPASGQSGEVLTERNIRFYRTMGLVDAPEGRGAGYDEKHLLQLIAIRLLQAQGVPLRRIRELLYGRTLEELREIRRRGLKEAQSAPAQLRFAPQAAGEVWNVLPLDEDFLLVSRRGIPLTAAQREAVLRALRNGVDTEQPHLKNNE